MIVGIAGYRGYSDYDDFEKKLSSLNLKIDRIVSGGANGADKLAELYASQNKIPITIYSPDWKQYGKGAGLLRNTQIVNSIDYLIAFVSKKSVGTWDTIRKAKQNSTKIIPVKIFYVN